VETQTHVEKQAVAPVCAWPSKWLYPVVGVSTLALIVFWLLFPWEWAPVDDPGQVILLGREIAESGRLSGTFERFNQLYVGDAGGGVFRPAAWVYPVLVYQLPIGLAHVVRLVMVIVAIFGPLMYFRRMGASGTRLWITLLLLLAGASTLYQGLFLLSLQELSGAAFIGLGLLVRGSTSRIILWLVAALFKAPFAWLLIGNAVFLWRKNQRRQAAASGLLGFGVLAISALWSRGGNYSGGYNLDPLNPAMWENFSRLVEPMNALLLVSVVWWLIATNGRLARKSDWVVFLIGWAGYTLQMIPWGVTAYYMGPISYLFAIFLASTLTDATSLDRRQICAGMIMPIFVAFWLVRATLNLGFEINSVMVDAKQCLAPLSGSNTVVSGNLLYVTSSPEGPLQMKGTVERSDPSWRGTVSLENEELSGFLNPETTHYLIVGERQLPEGRDAYETCISESLRLYELAPIPSSPSS
jgi:hypothetical protein